MSKEQRNNIVPSGWTRIVHQLSRRPPMQLWHRTVSTVESMEWTLSTILSKIQKNGCLCVPIWQSGVGTPGVSPRWRILYPVTCRMVRCSTPGQTQHSLPNRTSHGGVTRRRGGGEAFYNTTSPACQEHVPAALTIEFRSNLRISTRTKPAQTSKVAHKPERQTKSGSRSVHSKGSGQIWAVQCYGTSRGILWSALPMQWTGCLGIPCKNSSAKQWPGKENNI